MGRTVWNQVKSSKNFNVHVYRRGITCLIISLSLSVIIGLGIFKIYLSEPERDYYATSGITPPIQLTSMSAPNTSSQPLLEPDPVVGIEDKVIPQ